MYSKQALERLSQLDTGDINTFFDQVPHRDRRFILSVFRPPAGFRPNTEAAADMLSQKLASRLSSKASQSGKAQPKDIAVMERMWDGWLRANLGDEEFVGQCVEEWRNTLNVDDEALSESEQDIANATLFSRLTELTNRNLCGREDLELAFKFSPFNSSKELEKTLAVAKSRSEIKEAQEFTMLPAKIATLGNTIDNISSRSLSNEGKVSELASLVDHLETDVTESVMATKSLTSKVKKLSRDRASVSESIDSIHEKFGELRNLIDASQRDVEKKIEGQSDELARIERAINTVQSNLAPLLDRVDTLDENSQAIEAAITEMRSTYGDRRVKPEPEETRSTINKIIGEDISFGQRITLVQIPLSDQSRPLSDRTSILQALEDNYQIMGLSTREAVALSREVFCGLACGQVILIRGLFANIVATTTGNTLSSECCYHASVPIGSLKDESLFSETQELGVREEVPCIVLQNANRSPFEGYGRPLLDHSLRRFLNTSDPGPALFVLATVDDGPAGLPLYPSFLPAGPIIDTDSFGWRHKKKSGATLFQGNIETKQWTKILDSLDSQELGSMDEFDELIDSLAFDSTTIRRLRWQYTYLQQVCDAQRSTTALQSLAFGWMVPQLIAAGDFDTDLIPELEDGRLDGETADSRLRQVLKAAGEFGQ